MTTNRSRIADVARRLDAEEQRITARIDAAIAAADEARFQWACGVLCPTCLAGRKPVLTDMTGYVIWSPMQRWAHEGHQLCEAWRLHTARAAERARGCCFDIDRRGYALSRHRG